MAMEMVIGDKSAGPKLWGEAPSVISGPFLVVCAYINRSHSIDLNQAKNVRRSCTVQFMIYPEPKMRVLQGTHSVRIEEAADENGNSLAIPGLAPDMGFNTNTWPWNMSASLMPQVNTGQKIAKLRGAGRFLIQTRSAQTEIADIQNVRGVSKVVGGKKFTLKEVRKQGNQYVAMITLYRAGWSVNEWNYMMYPQQTFRMVDARGVPLMRLGNGNSQWRRFDRWAARGRWDPLLAALRDPDMDVLILDSTAVRAHPCAAGAKKNGTAPAASPSRPSAAAAAGSAPRSTPPATGSGTRSS
jgi:hypothetical protein